MRRASIISRKTVDHEINTCSEFSAPIVLALPRMYFNGWNACVVLNKREGEITIKL